MILEMLANLEGKMDWLLIGGSYLLISVVVSIAYIGIVLASFMLMKKLFKMNETKWDHFFRYKNGFGLYLALVLPYLLTLAILYPATLVWFDWIDVTYKLAATNFIFLLLALTGLWKLPKLKQLKQKLDH